MYDDVPFTPSWNRNDVASTVLHARRPTATSALPNGSYNPDLFSRPMHLSLAPSGRDVPKYTDVDDFADRRAYAPSQSPPPVRTERKTAIKVDKYDGSTCIETFLLKFGHIATYNQWCDRDKAAHLAAALSGSAGLILWNLPNPTFDELVARLRQRYGAARAT
jgi:hypothetical protein